MGCDGLAQGGDALIGRVAVDVEPARLRAQLLPQLGRRWRVGVADAERDDVDAARPRLGDRAHEARRQIFGGTVEAARAAHQPERSSASSSAGSSSAT